MLVKERLDGATDSVGALEDIDSGRFDRTDCLTDDKHLRAGPDM